ncbi:MAG: MGMT family protein [Christensenellales bacterium]|jgi:methylated-DNA-protein-cysteine methyltransferase-like protein
MTGFTQSIYDLVARIPRGRVASYGQLSLLAGRPGAARIVGAMMARIPGDLDLPAHRVLYSGGRLCPEEVFGPGVQRQLLEHEGVGFLPDGRVDMRRFRWDGK